jgi:hypothetical protein
MPTLLDRILGTWAAASGISLIFTFFKQYRARPRYAYLLFLGIWAGLWGYEALRNLALLPRWVMWLIFLLGIGAMLRDSARRYRESSERLRAERLARLQDSFPKPPDDPSGG